jgi:hypothetical protein
LVMFADEPKHVIALKDVPHGGEGVAEADV